MSKNLAKNKPNFKYKKNIDLISLRVGQERILDKEDYFILGFTVGKHSSTLMKCLEALIQANRMKSTSHLNETNYSIIRELIYNGYIKKAGRHLNKLKEIERANQPESLIFFDPVIIPKNFEEKDFEEVKIAPQHVERETGTESEYIIPMKINKLEVDDVVKKARREGVFEGISGRSKLEELDNNLVSELAEIIYTPRKQIGSRDMIISNGKKVEEEHKIVTNIFQDASTQTISKRELEFKVEEEEKEAAVATQVIQEAATQELIQRILLQEEREVDERRIQQEKMQIPTQCQICLDYIQNTDLWPLDTCGHLFHKDCMDAYLQTQLNDRKFPLQCPLKECQMDISNLDLKELLNKKDYNKFEVYSFKNFIDFGGRDEFSYCPSPQCNYVFVYIKGKDPPRFKCPLCKNMFCLNCRTEYHYNISCKQYQEQKNWAANDEKFVDFAKGMKLKMCPKCKFWVEKNEGCNHMTCRCKMQFCYVCGGNYPNCYCKGK